MSAKTPATPEVALHADWDGQARAPVLVLLHGFTGSRASWDGVRAGLRRIGPTLAVDLLGHGASPVPEELDPYTLPSCLEQLEALLEQLGISCAWWVGYSMGGRVALQLAAHKPQLVAGLVLESTTAGLESPAARQERKLADEALGQSILSEGLEAFTARWLAQPLFARLARLPPAQWAEQRAQRLACNPLGLSNSLRGMGTGSMEPLWERLGDITVPTLVLAGAEDKTFSALAQRLCAGLPQAKLRILPRCGHTPHVENAPAFLESLYDYFQRQHP